MNRPTVRGDREWHDGDGDGGREGEPADQPVDDGSDPHPYDVGRYDVGPYDDDPYDNDPYDNDEQRPDVDDGEYEIYRPPPSALRKVASVLVGVAILVVVAIAGASLYVRSQLDPGGQAGGEVNVTIPTGSSTSDIADILEQQGVIPDANAFRYYLRYKDATGFEAGNFLFHTHMAAWDALAVLRGGPLPPDEAHFTVPEGLRLSEVPGQIVDDIPALSADRITQLIATMAVRPASLPADATTLEGYLFPSTYQVGQGQDEQAALQRMADQFDAVARQDDLEAGAAALGLTSYQVVIVASLIQEEAGIPEEMSKIARVIYNRLDQHIPLGIDATICYGLDKACADLTRTDLETDGPYNSRTRQGLPPTPVASPGEPALQAALHPADGDWIYYVRDPDATRTPPGGHFFTDSDAEFEEVKQECEAAGLGCG